MTGPDAYKNRPYTERFQLGTEDDPQAENPDTKRAGFTGINWGRWKSLAKAAGVFCGDSDEEFDALLATKADVVGDMTKRSYEDKTTHEMKGPFNNLARFYAPGKKEPKVEEAADPTPSGGSQGKPQGSQSKESGKGSGNGNDKTHCDECDKDVSKRIFESHKKRHELERVEAENGEEE
jgi:hypothetical protein